MIMTENYLKSRKTKQFIKISYKKKLKDLKVTKGSKPKIRYWDNKHLFVLI
jgi:hypothetical protein